MGVMEVYVLPCTVNKSICYRQTLNPFLPLENKRMGNSTQCPSLQHVYMSAILCLSNRLQNGSTAIIVAAKGGHLDVVQLLINGKADIQSANKVCTTQGLEGRNSQLLFFVVPVF